MFEPTTSLPLGPVSIPLELLGWVLGFLIGTFLLQEFERGRNQSPVQSYLNAVNSSFLVGIVIYKFWPVVEQYTFFLENPFALLMYSGGRTGLKQPSWG
ncbi:hypothetical protein [Brevibacillus sp. H7]|uniref:hypothetical protein n=1 Tax=Brevibacillus sp. H7 TaxID=3349138 RepID=UPI0037F82F04